MRVYILRRGDVGYDEYEGFVLWAASETEARQTANALDICAIGSPWLDTAKSHCEVLTTECAERIAKEWRETQTYDVRTLNEKKIHNRSGVVLGSFKAG